MTVKIEPSWREALQNEFDQPYFAALAQQLHAEKAAGRTIFPPGGQIFRAFDLCPLDQTKVVILGQDPYHGYGQAMGLCFSVPQGVPAPPSLKNIFREIETDLGVSMSGSPDLTPWAREGWYEGPFGPEADCCLSLLVRHPASAGEPSDKAQRMLIKAGEEGEKAYEGACAALHREWAERLRKGDSMPDISQRYFRL